VKPLHPVSLMRKKEGGYTVVLEETGWQSTKVGQMGRRMLFWSKDMSQGLARLSKWRSKRGGGGIGYTSTTKPEKRRVLQKR